MRERIGRWAERGKDKYIHSIPGKKVGILATGCRCYGAKNGAKWQKKRRKIAKINPKSKEKFALSARIIFWLPSFLKF